MKKIGLKTIFSFTIFMVTGQKFMQIQHCGFFLSHVSWFFIPEQVQRFQGVG